MANESKLELVIKAVDNATAPIRKIAKQIEKLGKVSGIKDLMGGFKKLGSSISAVGSESLALAGKLAAMAAGAAFALFSVTRSAIDAGDELNEMAKRTGLAVDAYASLRFAAEQSDISQEEFNAAMDQFNKRLGEAKAGGGALLGFLNKVSPALAKQVKGAKSTEEAMSLMTSAFERVQDPAKRAALSAAAFGKSGLQWGQFLGQGSAAIQELQSEYIALAGSQEKFAELSDKADNALRKTEVAFGGIRNAMVVEFLPALLDINKAVLQFVMDNREGLTKWAKETAKAISDWIAGGGIDRLIGSIKDLMSTVKTAVAFIGGFKGVLVLFGAYLAGPLVASIFSVVSALVTMAPAIASVAASFGPALLAAAPFIIAAGAIALAGYQIYKNWDGIKELFSDIWDILKEIGKAFVGMDSNILSTVQKKLGFEAGYKNASPTGPRAPVFNRSYDVPSPAASLQSSSPPAQAKVQVDFTGMPKGARVSLDRNSTAEVNYSVGPSSLVSQ